MANLVYPEFLKHLASGTIDLVNDTLYVALLSGTYSPNTGNKTWHDLSVHQSYDTLGSYKSGGALLAGRTLTITNGEVIFDASDVTWNTATVTASGAVIWYSGSPTVRHLIAWQDLGGNQSSTNGTFQIVWNNTNGIFKIGAS